MLEAVALADDVRRSAERAAAYAGPREEVTAVLPVEPAAGERLYLCSFGAGEPVQSWLAIDANGVPVTSREHVREAASLAAICEIAEESANVPSTGEPRLASLAYLDSFAATAGNGDFAGALKGALPAVEELARDIEANYKVELS
jgi:hypothetical protein